MIWHPFNEKPPKSWEYLVCFDNGVLEILKYWTDDDQWTDRLQNEVDWDDWFATPVGWCEMPYPPGKTIEYLKHRMGMSV